MAAPATVREIAMPPHSVESECAVLGACLGWSDAYPRVAGVLSADDFFRDDHRRIWRAIDAIGKEAGALDVVTVSELLEKSNELDDVGGLVYLVSLTDNTPSAANVEQYAGLVRKQSLRRQVARLCTETMQNLRADPDTLLSELQSGIDALSHGGAGKSLDWMDVLSAGDDAIHEARKRAEEGSAAGVMTGLPALDRRIGGLPNGRLIVLAGRPSLGKSAMAQQFALHAARCGHAVGTCSLEMNADEIAIRSYANVLGVNGTALQYGDSHAVGLWTEKLRDHPMIRYRMFLDEATYSLAGIVARAHEWRHKHGINMFIVDHIGLVEETGGDSENERIGVVTRALKKLAKRLGIPVLAVCQLNRSSEKEKRRPRLSDLRSSGNIEQDCDVALFLHSEDSGDDEDAAVEMEIGALKTRYGRKGWLAQRFMFDGRTQRFMEKVPGASFLGASA